MIKVLITLLFLVFVTCGYGQSRDSTTLLQPFVTDEMPQFPAGEDSALSYLRQIKFDCTLFSSLTNKIFVRCIIDTNGSITNVSLAKGIHPPIDSLALKHVEQMANWTPAKENGKLTPVQMVLPVGNCH